MPFDSTSELWKDYLARFYTFASANSVPEDKVALVFLTNQTTAKYKLLATLAGQQSPSRRINDLKMKDITTFKEANTIRNILSFKSDSSSGLDHHGNQEKRLLSLLLEFDRMLVGTRFVCAVKNEGVLKAVFKLRDDELTIHTITA